jgi:hypothetical protein
VTAVERPSHAHAATTIAEAVRAHAPWIERVEAEPAGTGYLVRLFPDRLMVKARALQQGLADESVEAALRSPRFRQALENAVARANAGLSAEHRIERHEVAPAE